MFGSAPKIGKSWMVLDIGVRVAKGEPIWNLPTKRGTVLYLALEDSLARIQERLCKLTDDVPCNLFNMSTTADIYSHLDANAKSEAGRAIESVLSITTESED